MEFRSWSECPNACQAGKRQAIKIIVITPGPRREAGRLFIAHPARPDNLMWKNTRRSGDSGPHPIPNLTAGRPLSGQPGLDIRYACRGTPGNRPQTRCPDDLVGGSAMQIPPQTGARSRKRPIGPRYWESNAWTRYHSASPCPVSMHAVFSGTGRMRRDPFQSTHCLWIRVSGRGTGATG